MQSNNTIREKGRKTKIKRGGKRIGQLVLFFFFFFHSILTKEQVKLPYHDSVSTTIGFVGTNKKNKKKR